LAALAVADARRPLARRSAWANQAPKISRGNTGGRRLFIRTSAVGKEQPELALVDAWVQECSQRAMPPLRETSEPTPPPVFSGGRSTVLRDVPTCRLQANVASTPRSVCSLQARPMTFTCKPHSSSWREIFKKWRQSANGPSRPIRVDRTNLIRSCNANLIRSCKVSEDRGNKHGPVACGRHRAVYGLKYQILEMPLPLSLYFLENGSPWSG
jgi:hypothetical protein